MHELMMSLHDHDGSQSAVAALHTTKPSKTRIIELLELASSGQEIENNAALDGDNVSDYSLSNQLHNLRDSNCRLEHRQLYMGARGGTAPPYSLGEKL